MATSMSAESTFGALLDGVNSVVRTPLNEFIFKVQTRCNINCTYCYVYNMGDSSWQRQPKMLSPDIARQAVRRIAEHARAHDLSGVLISIHGGEPLLGGVAPIVEFTEIVREELGDIQAHISLQTNATLVTEEIASTLAGLGVGVGVSLDGPARANKHRVDVRGRPTHEAARAGIAELARHSGLLRGVLCVIPIDEDPVVVFDYLSELGAPSVDFMFPHHDWTNRPPYKGAALALGTNAPAPYGEWLVAVFERWLEVGRPVSVRLFDDIIHLLLGGTHSFEGLGLSPARLVVVESDGAIELVDHLGPSFEDAASTGLSVLTSSFDDALGHPGVACRQAGASVLDAACQRCPLLSVCGGGLITHRYHADNGYQNPSVYCSDLFRLITHIRVELSCRLNRARKP